MIKMIGRFVFSKAGHDMGTLYVVTAEEEKYVYLCDGRLKTSEKPKRKRKKHIQPTNRSLGSELVLKLQKGEKVPDEQIRYAIKQYNNF